MRCQRQTSPAGGPGAALALQGQRKGTRSPPGPRQGQTTGECHGSRVFQGNHPEGWIAVGQQAPPSGRGMHPYHRKHELVTPCPVNGRHLATFAAPLSSR